MEQAITSVLEQDYDDIEYIVVDPGSTDGSREVVQKYEGSLRAIFEPDEGPADGLNKGFDSATGQIYGFINADDWLYPNCVSSIVDAFRQDPGLDVVSGHADIVDADGKCKRRVYSDRFSFKAWAYRACSIAQQATFFRADAFRRAGGFNADNRLIWDGELWLSLAEHGARFGLIDDVLAAFRVYGGTLTSEHHSTDWFNQLRMEMFERVMQRQWRRSDALLRAVYVARRYFLEPRSLYQRLVNGAVN